MKLYGVAGSNNVRKVQAVANHLGMELEEVVDFLNVQLEAPILRRRVELAVDFKLLNYIEQRSGPVSGVGSWATIADPMMDYIDRVLYKI